MQPALGTRRLLIAEDEALILMMVKDTLTDGGYEPIAATDLESALALARTGQFLGAYLDINLSGEPVYPVADILLQRHIPFLLATGYDETDVSAGYQSVPSLRKPFSSGELLAAISALLPPDQTAT